MNTPSTVDIAKLSTNGRLEFHLRARTIPPLSRQKSSSSRHHSKAGALNVLLRVSAVMSNAPIILTQDCDMYSNDPQIPLHALCYLLDPSFQGKVGYVQFPQRFYGVTMDDTYDAEYRRVYQINPPGLDGLMGPDYFGSGCFFHRRALFGGPTTLAPLEAVQLCPDHKVDKPISSQDVLELAQRVAGCNYESQTEWGKKIGFRYGSLVEDFFTGYQLHGLGWKSVFCNPERAAFLGGVPITLLETLNQCKRWTIGLNEVNFSKYNPLIYGTKSMGALQALCYANYSSWPLWAIPLTTYAFVPQLALLKGVAIFPKMSDPWFLLYLFLFTGAYAQDFIELVVIMGGSVQTWWNAQRMWLIRGLTCFLFGSIEYLLNSLGVATPGFAITSKVLDKDESKRYKEGLFEFGVPSPVFVPLMMTAIISLLSLIWGTIKLYATGSSTEEGMCLQMLLIGFVAVNTLPIYEAISLRSDTGKMPTKTTATATLLVAALYIASNLIL